MLVDITLSGGPQDGRVIQLYDPADMIDVGDPTDAYVKSADPTVYVWTVGIKPPLSTEAVLEDPLPDAVKTHLQHLRDYLAEDPASITNAESIHVIKDLIRAVHYLNGRLATE